MLGNDVVDVEQARQESHWKRKGYIEKIFSPSEQYAIKAHHNPELLVWVYWSMKEAAYKIYNRQTNVRAFIPHKLNCTIAFENETIFTGIVELEKFQFFTQTAIADNSIKTIAATTEADLKQIKEVQGNDVKKDITGLPYIIQSGKAVPVSVSHHGRIQQVVALNI